MLQGCDELCSVLSRVAIVFRVDTVGRCDRVHTSFRNHVLPDHSRSRSGKHLLIRFLVLGLADFRSGSLRDNVM